MCQKAQHGKKEKPRRERGAEKHSGGNGVASRFSRSVFYQIGMPRYQPPMVTVAFPVYVPSVTEAVMVPLSPARTISRASP